MKNLSLIRHTLYTLWDAASYYGSFCRYSFLNGKYQSISGKYVNWNRTQECYPNHFLKPSSIEEIISIVKASKKLRVVGSGHSFNSMLCCDDTLLSLDNYSKILSFDQSKKQIRVQAGIHLRELLTYLEKENLAMPITGAYAAQSLAGVIATNVHGTGKDVGFISDNLLEISIIDGSGQLHTLSKGSDAFRAVVGSLGLTGVIVEVLIQCVDVYFLKKTQTLLERSKFYESMDEIVNTHDHAHFQLVERAGAQITLVETWDKTNEKPKPGFLYSIHANQLKKMSAAALVPVLSDKAIYKFAKKSVPCPIVEVLPAHWAFIVPRFPSDIQFEQALPYHFTIEFLKELMEIQRKINYHPFVYTGVRFTPNPTANPLLFPSYSDKKLTWVDPNCHPIPEYRAWHNLVNILAEKYRAFPHLGKALDSVSPHYIKVSLGENLKHFLIIREEFDPERKFLPPLAEKLFL